MSELLQIAGALGPAAVLRLSAAAMALGLLAAAAGYAQGRRRGRREGRQLGRAERTLELREQALAGGGCPVCGARAVAPGGVRAGDIMDPG